MYNTLIDAQTIQEHINDPNWILVDFFDIIVHVFYPETRRFYEIEDLWSDAKRT